MTPKRSGPALVMSLVGGTAHGQCPPYTATQLGEDMASMAAALRAASPEEFQKSGAALEEGLPCIQEPMAPGVLANVYRYM